jgi:two-component system, OmpR family, KDP operon response regulator KdpE
MTAALPRILLVEDEQPIRKFLRTELSGAQYQLDEAATAEQALKHAEQSPPDLVILDLGLPDMDGQVVIRQLRTWFTAPIIVLSARNQDQEKILALDNGANDYLTKPFSTGELLARVRVALRHSEHRIDDTGTGFLECGDLKVDLAGRRVFVADSEVHLTRIEYKLLTILMGHPGKVLTHRQLLEKVWGPQQIRETHYLRVFMASIRRKIEADPAQPKYLITEQGIGYRMACE